MRGSLTFKVTPDQQIRIDASLYELTDLDILKVSSALNEQALKLQLTLIKKQMERAEVSRIIQPNNGAA